MPFLGEASQDLCLVVFLVSLRYKSIKARIKMPSTGQNLVLYWPQLWAQLMLHSPIETNTCVWLQNCFIPVYFYPINNSRGVQMSVFTLSLYRYPILEIKCPFAAPKLIIFPEINLGIFLVFFISIVDCLPCFQSVWKV